MGVHGCVLYLVYGYVWLCMAYGCVWVCQVCSAWYTQRMMSLPDSMTGRGAKARVRADSRVYGVGCRVCMV